MQQAASGQIKRPACWVTRSIRWPTETRSEWAASWSCTNAMITIRKQLLAVAVNDADIATAAVVVVVCCSCCCNTEARALQVAAGARKIFAAILRKTLCCRSANENMQLQMKKKANRKQKHNQKKKKTTIIKITFISFRFAIWYWIFFGRWLSLKNVCGKLKCTKWNEPKSEHNEVQHNFQSAYLACHIAPQIQNMLWHVAQCEMRW